MNTLNLILCLALSGVTFQGEPDGKTSVQFHTTNKSLQRLYDMAEQKALWNVRDWDDYQVLVEGAGYEGVWLETQPMGGVMYAKRNLKTAEDNIRIFIDNQRSDGRYRSVIAREDTVLTVHDGSLSGLCMPMPALELYYWLGKDRIFLERLYHSLQRFDDYLWKTRDSDGDGCLETWCVWDTGEDNSTRFGLSPSSWGFDYPPTEECLKTETNYYRHSREADSTVGIPVPVESMDLMSYSYTCRDVLARASALLANGQEAFWRQSADEVKEKIRDYLWDEKKHACYDRDKFNRTMNVLIHNNLRCMWYGSFDQEMADGFVRYHLLNPDEFWTPMPLTSIAVNDPLFRNSAGNDWSGQPQGLTYQRSIRALENYGHYAEITRIGTCFLKAVGDSLKFTQQFDAFTGTINNTSDGYGPSILSTLEFVSRRYGVHYALDTLHWSCLADPYEYSYTQRWGDREFRMETHQDVATCYVNGREVFSFTRGIRVVSDPEGKILSVIGITPDKRLKINISGMRGIRQLRIAPNEICRFN